MQPILIYAGTTGNYSTVLSKEVRGIRQQWHNSFRATGCQRAWMKASSRRKGFDSSARSTFDVWIRLVHLFALFRKMNRFVRKHYINKCSVERKKACLSCRTPVTKQVIISSTWRPVAHLRISSVPSTNNQAWIASDSSVRVTLLIHSGQ